MQNYVAQGNFTAGALSPLLRARADTEMFFNGAQELRNVVVMTQGGVARRPGTKAHPHLQIPWGVTALHKVQIDEEEAYAIHFTDADIRIIDAVTGVLLATVTDHGYAPADVPNIRSHQSVDVLFLTHNKYPPRKLVNYGGGTWGLVNIDLQNGPFLDRQTSDKDIALTISGTTDRMTLTAVGDEFTSATLGSYVEYRRDGVPFIGMVTSKVSNKSVIIEPHEDDCYLLDKEVYSPGVFLRYDTDAGKPLYGPIPDTGSEVKIAFSNSGVVTQSTIGGFLKFVSSAGKWYWVKVTGIHEIPEAGSYGSIAICQILTWSGANYATVVVPSARVTKAVLTSTDPNFFVRTRDGNRWYRLSYGENTVYAQATAEGTSVFSRNGAYTTGSDFIAADIRDISAGIPVTGQGIPPGAYVTKVQSYVPAQDVYDEGHYEYTHLYGNRLQIKVWIPPKIIGQIPEQPEGFYISANTTDGGLGAPLVFGTSNTAEVAGSITVRLSRTIPIERSGVLYNSGTADIWYKGAFYQGNYPALVGNHEERLVFASSPLQPQTLWLSRTGRYEDFAPVSEETEVLDDTAITVTVNSPNLDRITWMSTKDRLCFGTTGGEWVLWSGTQKNPLTPRNCSASNQTAYGSLFGARCDVGRDVLFIQSGGARLRQMRFDYGTDGFISKDLTIRSDHLLSKYGGAKDLILAPYPQQRILVLCNSGDILSLTYEPDQEVFAWSHFMDGCTRAFTAVNLQGRTVVFLAREHGSGDTFTTCIETVTLGGPEIYLDHVRPVEALIGSIVDTAYANRSVVFWDSERHSDPVPIPMNGFVEVPPSFFNRPGVYVGVPFLSVATTFPVEPQTPLGVGLGRYVSIIRSLVRIHESGGFEFLIKDVPVTEKSLRILSDRMDLSVPVYSRDVEIPLVGYPSRAQTLTLRTSRPWPLTILSVTHTIDQQP